MGTCSDQPKRIQGTPRTVPLKVGTRVRIPLGLLGGLAAAVRNGAYALGQPIG
jgi:hypothetical protein